MAIMPDYLSLQASLLRVDAMMEASEAHGALCGMLCAQGSADIAQWQQHVFGQQEQGNVLLEEVANELQQLYLVTVASMNNELAEFELFLAGEDERLADQVQSLAFWCQGFLYGLAAGGITQQSELPEDTAELMQDFVEIARAVFDDEEGDSSEDDFMQLVEFVRVGVLLINEELQPLKRTQPVITETLH